MARAVNQFRISMKYRTFCRYCLALLLSLAVLVAVSGCGTPRRTPWANPADRKDYLQEQLKVSGNASQRYAQAEEDARKDGDAAGAEVYRQAKEKALQDYERYKREFSQIEAESGGMKP